VILVECVSGLTSIGAAAAAVRLARASDLVWARPLALVAALQAGAPVSQEMLAEIETGALALPGPSGYWAAWALAGLASVSPQDAVRRLELAAERGRALADPRQARRVVIGAALHAHRLGFPDAAREIRVTAPALPEGVMSELIDEKNAKEWLTDWEGSEWGAAAELAASKPSPEREEELSGLILNARKLDGYARHEVLASMAPWLWGMSSEELQLVVDSLSEQANQFERAEGLADLSPAFPPEQRPDVLRAALAPLEVIHDEYGRSVALAALAEHMDETERRRWVTIALGLARPLHGHLRTRGLVAVAAAADPGERLSLLGEALEALREADDFLKADLVRITAHAYARHGLVNEAVSAQAMFGTDEDLVEQLAAAAPSLDPGYLRGITVAAEVLSDPVRAQVIAAPVIQLREATRPDEALALARQLSRRYGTGVTATGLPAEILNELTDVAVEEARTVRDVIRLVRTFPYLPAEELPLARQRMFELLADPQNIKDREANLSQFVSDQLATEIARFAETIGDPRYLVRLLTGVLPRLDGSGRARAIEAARAALGTVEPDFVRTADTAQFVGAIGDEIGFDELQSVTAAVCDLDYIRDEPLRAVTSVALGLSRPPLVAWWNAVLPRLARRARETILDDIVILAPVVARLAGEPGLVRAAEAIEDASSWFSAQPG
jgi:hypothetical protein